MYSGDAAGSGEETLQITDAQRIEQALNFVGSRIRNTLKQCSFLVVKGKE